MGYESFKTTLEGLEVRDVLSFSFDGKKEMCEFVVIRAIDKIAETGTFKCFHLAFLENKKPDRMYSSFIIYSQEQNKLLNLDDFSKFSYWSDDFAVDKNAFVGDIKHLESLPTTSEAIILTKNLKQASLESKTQMSLIVKKIKQKMESSGLPCEMFLSLELLNRFGDILELTDILFILNLMGHFSLNPIDQSFSSSLEDFLKHVFTESSKKRNRPD